MSVTVYGFVSLMTACVCLVVWFFWAFLPEEVLRDNLGISYYPSKWWALAFPTWLLFSVWIMAFCYSASFFYVAPSLKSRKLLQDSYTRQQKEETTKFEIQNAIDLNLEIVNTLMFNT